MRYTLSTNDEQGIIGIQIARWEKEGKLVVVEKSETLVEIQARLDKVASALAILKKVGYNSEVMLLYLREKTHIGKGDIQKILFAQEQFLKQVGALR